MDREAINAALGNVSWTRAGITEQNRVLTLYARARSTLPLADIVAIDSAIMSAAGIGKQVFTQWLVAQDGPREGLLHAHWTATAAHQATVGPPLPAHTPEIAAAGPGVYPTSGWLGTYMQRYCANFESPDAFLFWSGVACLSAVVRRHVFFQFGTSTIYPNFYVILVAAPGRARKGPPIDAAEFFTRTIPDINFIDRTTTQRFPHDLAYRYPGKNRIGIEADAQGFLCSTELVSSLDDQSYNAGVIKFLLAFWDSPRQREHRTLQHGIIRLKNVHITLLGGTTPNLLQEALSHIMAGGGMLSRVIFVVEDRTSKRFSVPSPPDPVVERELVAHLAYINAVQGEIALPADALAWLNDWYTMFRDTLDLTSDAMAASLERRQAHLMKLAMILAISEDRPLALTPDLLQRADIILHETERKLPMLTTSLQATQLGKEQLRILEHIKAATAGPVGFALHSDLLRRNAPYGLQVEGLSRIIDTLCQGDLIEEAHHVNPTTNRRVRAYRAL